MLTLHKSIISRALWLPYTFIRAYEMVITNMDAIKHRAEGLVELIKEENE